MESNIKLEQFLAWGRLNVQIFSPELISADQLAKGSSPISQMVNANGLISKKAIEFSQAISNRSGSQMSNGEWFRNIGRRKVKNNSFFSSEIKMRRRVSQYRLDDLINELRFMKIEIEVRTISCNFLEVRRRIERFC